MIRTQLHEQMQQQPEPPTEASHRQEQEGLHAQRQLPAEQAEQSATAATLRLLYANVPSYASVLNGGQQPESQPQLQQEPAQQQPPPDSEVENKEPQQLHLAVPGTPPRDRRRMSQGDGRVRQSS
jgi:hypothetical protein